MKFSIGIEYALHCLLYMVKMDETNSVGIKELAEFQGVSETYLSKVFTKLGKAGITKAVPGVKGGYKLAKNPKEISFWNVVEAIENKDSFFQCAEIRQKIILLDPDNLPDTHTKCPCTIKKVMDEGENEMKKYLSKKTIAWLYEEVYHKILPKEAEEETKEWFENKRKLK